jgi:hypothetical protein
LVLGVWFQQVLSNPHLFHGAFLLDHTVKEVIMGEVKVLLSRAATLVNDFHGAVEEVVSEVVRPILHRTFASTPYRERRAHSYVVPATASYHEPLSAPWLDEISELRPSQGGLERRSTFLGSMIIRRSGARSHGSGSGRGSMYDDVEPSELVHLGPTIIGADDLEAAADPEPNVSECQPPCSPFGNGPTKELISEVLDDVSRRDDDVSSDGDLGGAWQKVDPVTDVPTAAAAAAAGAAAAAAGSGAAGPGLRDGFYSGDQHQQEEHQQEQQQLQAKRKQLLQAVVQGWHAGSRRGL